MNRTLDWLDERTDYRRLLAPIRNRVLPNGPSWWYSSASCLLWVFVVQLVTGLLMMATYSPSTTSAWASVHFIEQSTAGSFIRGVHYFAAQAMIVLFGIHVIRVLLAAAFRAPRELIWISGLLLFPLMLVWAITGNPLSGTQKGMAQIEVEGNILGSTPLVGRSFQQLLIGGEQVGHLTLTHLYFLHVGLLPIVVLLLLTLHISQIYRHGLSTRATDTSPSEPLPYWPHHTVRNMVVLSAVLGVISFLAIRHGAPLDAPADPDIAHSPRPEWYFLSLFELRRYFTGDLEFIATMVIPVAVLFVLLGVPLIDRAFSRRTSVVLRVLLVIVLAGGWGGLTLSSARRDWQDDEFQASVAAAHDLAARARHLADARGIPPEGAVQLLRNDPKTQGPRLFARHCASCHSHTNAAGEGIVCDKPTAPNLHGFGSVEWITGLLDPEQFASEHYFGGTEKAEGDMFSAVSDLFDAAGDEEDSAAAVADLRDRLGKVAAVLAAESNLRHTAPASGRDLEEGVSLLAEFACTDCHKFRDEGDLGSAPDLTGYGSRAWLAGMIADPNGERFYPDDTNDRMPAFAKDPHDPKANLLSPAELDLLVSWLRGDSR